MINSIILNRLVTLSVSLVFAMTCILLLTSCGEEEANNEEQKDAENVVEITAVHDTEENQHIFKMSTYEIPTGWTTFEFNNSSSYDHFFLIYKVPQEGIEAAGDQPILDYWYQSITEPFQTEFNPYIDGEIGFSQFTENLVGEISEAAPWFFDPGAQTMGGPGFTAAGLTSETTVYLESGEYIAECYVKNEEEVFHSAIGMLEHFSVTQEDSGCEEPVPTTQVTISSTNGIQFTREDLQPGSNMVEIFFEDQKTYGHLVGHNVQLVKLNGKDEQELLNNLSGWLDWRERGSLVNRAPEGANFVGGTMEMTEGGRAYYRVNLEPGDYAWIAEIPDPADHNMLKTFTITDQ